MRGRREFMMVHASTGIVPDRRRRIAPVLFGIALCAGAAPTQAGSIAGTVTAGGGAVDGAIVSAINTAGMAH
jgi:hypothetical protein